MAGHGMTMKPLQGVSFDIGTKRAVSYFLSDDEECKLTLMLAELVNDDEANGLAATRMTVAVEVGKAARLDTAEGKSLEFKCQPGGQEMSIDVSSASGRFGGQGEKGAVSARVLRLAKKAKWSQSERLIPSVRGMSFINALVIELIRSPGRANDQASCAGQLLARLTSRGPTFVGCSMHSAGYD